MRLINLLCFFLSFCLLSFLVLISSFLLASPGLFLRVSLRVSLLFVFCGLSSFALLLLFCFFCLLPVFSSWLSPFSFCVFSSCFSSCSLLSPPSAFLLWLFPFCCFFFLSVSFFSIVSCVLFFSPLSVSLCLSLPRRAGLLFLESRPLVIVLYPRYGHITPAWRLFPFIVLLLLCAMIVAALCDLPCASPFSAYPPSSWILR